MESLYQLVDWKGLIAESLETEGTGLTTYTQRYATCEQIIVSNCLSTTTNWEKSLLISYLELQTLCQDNSYTSAAVSWVNNTLRIQIENLAAQISAILTYTMTPTFIPMTSTWLRRPRQDHETLMARQDLITFYNWNISIIHHMRELIDYGYSTTPNTDPNAYSSIVYGLEQLMISAKKALDNAPENTFVAYVNKVFQAKMEGSFTPTMAGIIKAYMLFQELHSELKSGGTLRGDPYLGNKFDTFEMHFEAVYKKAFSVPAQRLFQDAAMKVYTEWRKSPMLYSRYGNQQAVAILTKAERILCRIDKALKAIPGIDKEVLGTLISDNNGCLESIRKSTSTIQYAQSDAEMNMIMLRDIARCYVRK